MGATYARVGAFFALTGLASLLLALTLADYKGLGPTVGYRAVFTDASFLKEGDPVRIAGVDVGDVEEVRLRPDRTVQVDFRVQRSRPLPTHVRALIRYKNLVGDRVLTLERPPHASTGAPTLPAGATIPLADTEPALSLDELTGGFKPLISAVDPGQVNELTRSLLAIVQGQTGSLQELVGSVAVLTNSLADRGAVIDRVITNFQRVLAVTDQRRPQLDQLVRQLKAFVQQADDERKPILDAVRDIGGFADDVARLLRDTRPDIRSTLASAGATATRLNRSARQVDAFLEGLGPALDAVGGIGVYGDFFNFYLCNVRIKVSGPGGKPVYTPWVDSSERRCNGRPSS